MKYLNKFNLSEKNAIVVGGAGLIGKEITIALSESGASVIVIDLNKSIVDDIIEKYNFSNISFEKLDLENIDELESNFKKILKKIDRLDIFINCSYPRPKVQERKSFNEVKFKYFRKIVDMQLNSFCWLAKMAAQKMRSSNYPGSIIQFSSIYGVVGQNLNIYKNTDMTENVAYSAIKGGIINYTRLMASYFGKYNIRVNSISPGGIFDNQNETFIKAYTKFSGNKGMLSPEDISDAVNFLISDQSKFINGQNLIVDDGFSL